ncbi:hypothetical protein L249_5714 [Ophiocordyceps polyrhachis-furcata BCC 54312]|uniref:p-aminobenzoic acid synthase n=1 Tax=Ophiocordyceps polyrhachis-furcata BCC 54312 TaxID=1330021 RepID=A0A367KZW0_9HYPO|nr:hypothetical protein L249_5714 [Ophiocordyceps polyrhachis-furcata BCC 54312]
MAEAETEAATQNAPRTWLLTAALSPLAVRLIRRLLSHGDHVVACLPPHEMDDEERSAEFRQLISECKAGGGDRYGWRDRIRGIRCDGRMSSCGAAVAEAVQVFGRIDILLCCRSEAVVGTVEELSTTPLTQNLIRDQFEAIFFTQVNFIKATLPTLRSQHTGHIIILSSIGGHIGTPGMSMYTAATWALEGFCDSLAYEIAPFNLKLTIVQPNKEIQSLTNRLIFAPQMPAYADIFHNAPSIREMLIDVLNANPETAMPLEPMLIDVLNANPETAMPLEPVPSEPFPPQQAPATPDSSSLEPEAVPGGQILYRYPRLPPFAADRLVAETIHALTAIGGHENPPSRHIVGFEGALAVKEKLKTVTEEMEDFVDASLAVDIFDSVLKEEASRRGPPEPEPEPGPGFGARSEPGPQAFALHTSPLRFVPPPTRNPRALAPWSAVDSRDARMNLDPLLPIAPARVRVLLLPLGRLKAVNFASYAERLQTEHVVCLRDVSADGRPDRNMFSPLAFPDGTIFYHLITHMLPPSHLALWPFDIYREPLVILALADGEELQNATSSSTHPESSVQALEEELEKLRESHPKALVHRVIVFDHVASETDTPLPDGVVSVPPVEDCKRTTLKTVMCDVSSLLLAEMTTLAKSFEGISVIESPGQAAAASRHIEGNAASSTTARRNSHFSLPHHEPRPNSAAGLENVRQARMSMPPMASIRPPINSTSSLPARPSTPVKGGLPSIPMSPDDADAGSLSSPEQKRDGDRVSVQGFGVGSPNDRWRQRGKGRTSVVIGSLYLQGGRWIESLKELCEAASTARSLNDHVWHGKALELIVIDLLLLAWAGMSFQVPAVCQPPQEQSSSNGSILKGEKDANPKAQQPLHIRQLQALLPELLDRIIALYSKVSSESLPPLPQSEAIIRFSRILLAIHLAGGRLDTTALDIIVRGTPPPQRLTTSPRLNVVPARQHIVGLLFKAFPSSATELLTTTDRASVLCGMAAVLGSLGYHRKRAMVMRELVSVLIGGLVEARTRGAADAGVHPAAGLVSLTSGHDGAMALDLGEGDTEFGLEALLEHLCSSYGIVGFKSKSGDDDDSDNATVARILDQSWARFFGLTGVKLNILRACINFSEALPDFEGVLKFSSDLLRTGGSGVAPGPRREDATPLIHKDEQVRLATNVSRTASLVQRLGMGHLTAEYWDEFLVRGITLEPPPEARTPVPHARSDLPGGDTSEVRSSQGVNPFIYNPFLKEPDEVVEQHLVAGEVATFRVRLQNTYDIEVDIESVRLCTEGVDFESWPERLTLGPYRTQLVRIRGRPREAGSIRLTGAMVKVCGCRERRFLIFAKSWAPPPQEKIKVRGTAALEAAVGGGEKAPPPEATTVSFNVIAAQPLVAVRSTTLPQSAVMILEGERQRFSVTMANVSAVPVDLMLFSFKDATQAPLQEALGRRDATPAELYEYELILSKRQALRLVGGNNDQDRSIAAGGEATFEFVILGKPGLTSATIQVDYTYLGTRRDEVKDRFFTRRASLDLRVTVNASVELTRVDALSLEGEMPAPLRNRLGSGLPARADEYCLLCVDLRNAWPSLMAVRLEGDDGLAAEEDVLPGKTSRLVLPVKRIHIEGAHEPIPSLNPSRGRQFVVSASKISPDAERTSRETFWFRERLLERVTATWRTTTGRNGAIELRNMRLTSRMIEALRVDEVEIEVTVDEATTTAYVDDFLTLTVRLTNRTATTIFPLVRLLPALRHRPLNVALDQTRKFAWNGTLQQLLRPLPGHGSISFSLGVTALCRGEFELGVSVEEVQTTYFREGSGYFRGTLISCCLPLTERTIAKRLGAPLFLSLHRLLPPSGPNQGHVSAHSTLESPANVGSEASVATMTVPKTMPPRRILFLDAYDSFTNNIVSLLKDVLGSQVTVHVLHMDLKTLDSDPSPDWTPGQFSERLSAFDAVVCGPGPGSPVHDADVGVFKMLWENHTVPVLGICLGFQSLVVHFGGGIRRLRCGGLHGLVHVVEPVDGADIFRDVPAFGATLYHSLCADVGQDHIAEGDWPAARRSRPCCAPDLVPLAWTHHADERILMAVRHASRPFWGIQYHPESIRTAAVAHDVVRNWFRAALESNQGLRPKVDSFTCVDSLSPSVCALNAAQLRPAACPWRDDMQSGLAAEAVSRPRYSCRRVAMPKGTNAADVAELLGLDVSREAVILDSSSAVRGDPRAKNSIIALAVDEALRLEYHVGDDYLSLRLPAARGRDERRQRIRLGLDRDGNIDPRSPWHIMSELWRRWRRRRRRREWIPEAGDNPVFKGGFLGFVTYEMGLSTLSPGLVPRNRAHKRPDVCMAWVKRSVVLDHEACVAYVQSLDEDDGGWMDGVVEVLEREARHGTDGEDAATFVDNDQLLRDIRSGGRLRFDVPEAEAYEKLVRRCQEKIREGESYELCLTAQTTVRPGGCGEHGRLDIGDVGGCDYLMDGNNHRRDDIDNHHHDRNNHNQNHDEGRNHSCNGTDKDGDGDGNCNGNKHQNNHNGIDQHNDKWSKTAWQIYRTLRGRQPAPFGSFVRLGGATIIGSSPERFLQHGDDGVCLMRPMKGTVRKSPSVSTLDQAEALLHVPKEEAENVMIVDLVRHDLSGVCGAGRVTVTDLLRVEEFVGVFQMSTDVRGVLPGSGNKLSERTTTGFDVLAATLPPGSMTGAPKKRSCEILASLEASERSLYSGVVGYLDVDGRADWSVTIRTIFRWEGEDVWRIGAGGAVTGLSAAEAEREEMFVKLCGPLRVLRDVV